MYLIDESYNPIEELTDKQYFWYYNIKENDYFLGTEKNWHSIETGAYILEIDKTEIWMPESYNIMIADFEVGLDTINPCEIINREFDAVTISNDIAESSLMLESIKIIGYEAKCDVLYPSTNKPVIIALNETKNIIVSSSDFYNKIKKLSIGEII